MWHKKGTMKKKILKRAINNRHNSPKIDFKKGSKLSEKVTVIVLKSTISMVGYFAVKDDLQAKAIWEMFHNMCGEISKRDKTTFLFWHLTR